MPLYHNQNTGRSTRPEIPGKSLSSNTLIHSNLTRRRLVSKADPRVFPLAPGARSGGGTGLGCQRPNACARKPFVVTTCVSRKKCYYSRQRRRVAVLHIIS